MGGQVLRHALRGRVRAVGGPEGVVDIEIGEAGEGLRQLRIVLGLARLEAGVLEQQDLPGPETRGKRLDVLADDRRGQGDLGPDQFTESLGDRSQRERRVTILRPAQMRGEDDRCAALAQQLDRRQGAADPGVVGDAAIVERDVEVDPDERAPALGRRVADARLAERGVAAQATAAGSSTFAASSTTRFE